MKSPIFSVMFKLIFALQFILIQINSFAQKRSNVDDSCIVSMNSVRFIKSVDGLIRVEKDSVPDLIRHIQYCSTDYRFPAFYQDRSFNLIIPGYLKMLSYGYGDMSFYYSFNDTNDADLLTTSIVVYYDFDGGYKKFFLNEISTKKQEAEIKFIGNDEIYLFKNWQNFFCGKLFLSGNTFVFYCTSIKDREQDLQKAILSFKWK